MQQKLTLADYAENKSIKMTSRAHRICAKLKKKKKKKKKVGSRLSFQEKYLKPKPWPQEETAASAAAMMPLRHCWCYGRHLHLTTTTTVPVMLSLLHQELKSTCNYHIPEIHSPLPPPLPGKWHPLQASFLRLLPPESKSRVAGSHWHKIVYRPEDWPRKTLGNTFLGSTPWGNGTHGAGNSPKQWKVLRSQKTKCLIQGLCGALKGSNPIDDKHAHL